jgi:hypothetical protein
MANATMYDPKNISGITTLYVTPTKESPIYAKAYPASISGVDGIVGGSGYTAATNVATTGGDGQGCTVNTTVSGGGAITAVAINKHGTGYKDNDTLTVAGGSGGTFNINVVAGQEDVELSPLQNTCAAGTLSTTTW